ncbi:MAG: hypothetical protein ACI9NC_004239 [Verrucomicrobiales bacterium]|jgi:hypothetical protein
MIVRCVSVFFLLAGLALGEEFPERKILTEFLNNYCLDCHDGDRQKGERDFESFTLPLTKVAHLVSAKEIIDQITLKEMPPKKADQPSDEERLDVVRALRKGVADAHGKIESSGARTVMRRLSNREYENTLKVLFGRRVDTLGLTADFPKEKTSRHIDTIGQSLVTSGFLLDQYFQSAHRLIESRLGKETIEPKDWHFTDHFIQYEELKNSHKKAFNYEFLCIYEQPNTDTRQGGYAHIEDFLEGVPVSGLYEIKAHTQAMHRDTHYDPKIFRIDFSEPFQIAVVPGDATRGHIHYPQAIEPILAEAIVADEKPEWITFKVWLEAGQTPRFIFPNGPYESRASVLSVNARYKDEFEGNDFGSGVNRAHLLKHGKLPHIRIGEIKIRGPLAEDGGSLEEVTVFGGDGFQADNALPQLYAFGQRAYRRPLTAADRDSIRKTFEKRIDRKAPPRQAALDTLKMILCSPSFLYLSEITDEKEKHLGRYDLASRLSYALWAGPPDAELLAADLSKPKVLREHIKRLLTDVRTTGFVNGFLDSWLNLRDLGSMPPPRESNRLYYSENWPDSMRSEARLFFSHLLNENESVNQFLDADFTFVDKRLANLYDLPEKKSLRLSDGFQRVDLKGNRHRGGLLGMAGVLTVSANGVETSPVTRGVWVSENILGIDPPPPPDVVPAIESDVRGATTIRERLDRHSSDNTCAECHRKIDPLGFSLEAFDPVGRWRTSYPKPKNRKTPGPKIDATGEFSSGEKYENFHEFKQILLTKRQDTFRRHLVTQVLSYATGRHMEPVDDYEIEEISQSLKEEGNGLRDLVIKVLSSEIFRSR